MEKLRCPECGSLLELAVDVAGANSRKINKDGSLHKVINRCTEKTYGASYLKCSKCSYSYDTEHNCGDERVPEFDDWIAEHLEEINQWE